MEKIVKKRWPAWKIVVIILSIIIGLPVLFVIGIFVTVPIFDSIDKAKFETLDTQSRQLFKEIETASAGSEQWTYDASCDKEYAGPWPTGMYYCSTTLSTELSAVTSATQLANLHDKYFPVIDGSQYFKEKNGLSKQLPDQFGVEYIVNSAEKQYLSKLSNEIRCSYFIELVQPHSVTRDLNTKYGASIIANEGRIIIEFSCRDKARENWYGVVTDDFGVSP